MRERVRDGKSPVGVRSDCTTSRAAPILDVVGGGIAASTALGIALSAQEGGDSASGSGGAVAVPLVIAMVPYFASAVYGFGATSNCIKFKKTAGQLDPDEDGAEDASELRRLRERVNKLESERP